MAKQQQHKIELTSKLKELEEKAAQVYQHINDNIRFRINEHYLLSKSLSQRLVLDSLTGLVQESAEMTINPESEAEVRHLLFDRLGLPIVTRTKSGTPSVCYDVLTKLGKDYDHQVISRLQLYREAASVAKHLKIVSKRVVDGKLAPEMGTTSGTLRAYGYLIALDKTALRSILPPEEDEVFLNVDYKAHEMALAALEAGEDKIIDMLNNGICPHIECAKELFKVNSPTERQREMTKEINYGISYGQTPSGISYNQNISVQAATDIQNRWKKFFPKLAGYWLAQRSILDLQGFTESPFGLKSFIDDNLSSKKAYERECRRCLNAISQSSSAIIMKRGLIRAHKKGLKTCLTKHDAVVSSVKRSEVNEGLEALTEAMSIEYKGFTFKTDTRVCENLSFTNTTLDDQLKLAV